jgi:hypothetical protein
MATSKQARPAKRAGGASPRTRVELYEIARNRDLPGRSKMPWSRSSTLPTKNCTPSGTSTCPFGRPRWKTGQRHSQAT